MSTTPNLHGEIERRPAAATPTAPPAQRSLLVDIVKGLAITMVAVGHTNQGMVHRALWHSGFGNRLDSFVYSFHMPAFFFVSGVFLCASLKKRGLARFMRTKVSTLLYPSWVWGLLLPLAPLVVGRYMILPAPPPLKIYLLDLVTGNGEWFLQTLFMTMLIVALLRKVPNSLLFLLSLIVQHFCRGPESVTSIRRAAEELPFLAAGMWLGPCVGAVQRVPAWLCLGLACALGFAVYCLTPASVEPRDWRFVPVGLLGTAMLFFVGQAMGTGRLGRAFAWVGVASIAVYLLGQFPQGFGRTVLLAVHVRQPAVQLLLPSLLATVLPAWVYQHRVKLRIGWLFLWPFGRQ